MQRMFIYQNLVHFYRHKHTHILPIRTFWVIFQVLFGARVVIQSPSFKFHSIYRAKSSQANPNKPNPILAKPSLPVFFFLSSSLYPHCQNFFMRASMDFLRLFQTISKAIKYKHLKCHKKMRLIATIAVVVVVAGDGGDGGCVVVWN